jgi:hypothetical protein
MADSQTLRACVRVHRNGRIVADLQDPDGAYPESTGVTETAERLYIQSLHAGYLGWMPNLFSSGRD